MRICSMRETEVIPTEQHVWLLKFDDSPAVHLGAIGSEVSVLSSPNDVPHSPKQGDRLLVLGSGPSSIDGHPNDEATKPVERWLNASGVDAYGSNWKNTLHALKTWQIHAKKFSLSRYSCSTLLSESSKLVPARAGALRTKQMRSRALEVSSS